MMLHSVRKISDLNTAVNDFFTAFKVDIISNTNKQWNEEDNKGSSLFGWKTMKYYTLLYLLILVYEEIQRTKDLNYSWSYYVEKFQLETYKKCLACIGIDIDKGYTAFKFDLLFNTDGIGNQGISINFRVGKATKILCSSNIKDLIDTPFYCINNIEGNLVNQGDLDIEATCKDFDTIQDTGPNNDEQIID